MQILDDIRQARILVVGDVMLDRYWWGSVRRISPEAPVPIVQLEEMSLVAGGAANVAANLAGLEATPYLFGIMGDDTEADLMAGIFSDAQIANNFIFPIKGRKTTLKTRIVAHSQHVVRIDQESIEPVSSADADNILSKIIEVLPEMDAMIVSDYDKGFLTDHLLDGLISKARGLNKLIVVDPKGRDFSRYAGATVITPNKREAADACALDPALPDVVTRSGKSLLEKLDLKALLITEGEKGMTIFANSGEKTHLDSLARNVYDVTGAGDTVIAAFTAAAASGSSFLEAAKLANAAAGLVVGNIGTTIVTAESLAEYLASQENIQQFESLHA